MEIKAVKGDIAATKAGAIIVNLFEGTEEPGGDLARIDRALDGAVFQLISQGEIKGKAGEITLIHSLGRLPAARVAIAGLGKKLELSRDRVRGVTQLPIYVKPETPAGEPPDPYR